MTKVYTADIHDPEGSHEVNKVIIKLTNGKDISLLGNMDYNCAHIFVRKSNTSVVVEYLNVTYNMLQYLEFPVNNIISIFVEEKQ